MALFTQIPYYFSVYKKYIGLRLYLVFVLTALAAATEGFGIAMLLPLIDAAEVGLGDQTLDQSAVKVALRSILDAMGIGDSMVGILTFIACVFLLKGLISFSAHAYQSHLKSQMMNEMRAMMFDRYNTMNYGYYSKRNTGHFVNIITTQISSLITSFEDYKQFLAISITSIVYLCTAFLLAWNFALMALASGIFLLFLFRGLNNYVHDLSRKTSQEQSLLFKFLVQTIQSFKYLSSTAQLDYLRSGVIQSIQRLASYMRSLGIARALTVALSEPIAVFFILMVIIIQLTLLDAPLAPIFVALVLFNRAMGSIVGIQQAWQATLNRAGAIEIVENEFEILEQNQEPDGKKDLSPLNQGIELRSVSFSYGQDHTHVFRDISLTIPANATVALVGESGAGKSTLVDLLTLILRPQKGKILIDGINSWEVRVASWRRQIGYVSQETVVFDDTVANNICLWKADYSKNQKAREQIEKAASSACAEQFIRELPHQFETFVGDRGVRLSGGQRQRLFLARELYKNPRLLILDEATSALDSESEKYIQESISALKGNTTVIIIAHRLSTIRNVDRIFVLEGGRIIEQGSYDDLMGMENGRFVRMVAMQSL